MRARDLCGSPASFADGPEVTNGDPGAWAANHRPAAARCVEPEARALRNQVAFELGDAGQDGDDQPAGGPARLEAVLDDVEADAPAFKGSTAWRMSRAEQPRLSKLQTATRIPTEPADRAC